VCGYIYKLYYVHVSVQHNVTVYRRYKTRTVLSRVDWADLILFFQICIRSTRTQWLTHTHTHTRARNTNTTAARARARFEHLFSFSFFSCRRLYLIRLHTWCGGSKNEETKLENVYEWKAVPPKLP